MCVDRWNGCGSRSRPVPPFKKRAAEEAAARGEQLGKRRKPSPLAASQPYYMARPAQAISSGQGHSQRYDLTDINSHDNLAPGHCRDIIQALPQGLGHDAKSLTNAKSGVTSVHHDRASPSTGWHPRAMPVPERPSHEVSRSEQLVLAASERSRKPGTSQTSIASHPATARDMEEEPMHCPRPAIGGSAKIPPPTIQPSQDLHPQQPDRIADAEATTLATTKQDLPPQVIDLTEDTDTILPSIERHPQPAPDRPCASGRIGKPPAHAPCRGPRRYLPAPPRGGPARARVRGLVAGLPLPAARVPLGHPPGVPADGGGGRTRAVLGEHLPVHPARRHGLPLELDLQA